jgi:predicted transcriptional regulator of viral defense system
MKWDEFLARVRDLPVIEAESLITSDRSIRVQISRWEKARKLVKLKRGIYVLSEKYQKREIDEFHLAALLKRPSYVSLEKALEYHGLIPEGVPVFTSVTPKRQARFASHIGVFSYRHIKPGLFWGYFPVGHKDRAGFVASPEKAILDLFHFLGTRVSPGYIEELRLQNLEKIDVRRLLEYARRFGQKKIREAAKLLIRHVEEQREMGEDR